MSALTLVPATVADRPAIESLIQLYLYDMTDEGVWPIGEDGRYGYDLIDRFWQHPYLLRVDGDLAGFALVVDECPLTGTKPRWFMAEFFILPPWLSPPGSWPARAGAAVRAPSGQLAHWSYAQPSEGGGLLGRRVVRPHQHRQYGLLGQHRVAPP